jgi:hypothetical protein
MLEVEREDEFAPVKNASGTDCPETARNLSRNRDIKWLETYGL